MSNRDDLDLDGDNLFDEGADAPVGEWDEDLMEEFPADDPAADDAPRTRAAPVAADRPAETAGVPAKRQRRPRRPRGGRGGVGVIVALTVFAAGVILGGGLVIAQGATPASLLDVSGFRDPAAIVDFTAHPVNAFWFGALALVLVAVAAGVAVERRLRDVTEQLRARETLIETIRGLDPDDLASWRRDDLQEDPVLAGLTTAVVGHFSLQQAKLTRYVGLEGELHRLEKALADSERAVLEGEWENPVAGSLADQALRILAARDELAKSSEQRAQLMSEQGPDLVANLRDARSWQLATLDLLNQQGAAVERLSRRLAKLAESGGQDEELALRRDRLRQALAAVRQEIAVLPAKAGARDGAAAGTLATLIERASRLAFQIAMEVARLGAKGERLLPLTQDLEELTTELRAVVDVGKAQPGAEDPRDRALEAVRGRLAELDPDAVQAKGPGEVASAIGELAPAASEVATGLVRLSQTFAVQTARLVQMLNLTSDLTGIQVDDGGDPLAAPGTGLLVDRFDPFASTKQPEGGLVADPFVRSGSLFDTPATDASSDFARTILPGQEDDLLAPQPPQLDPFAPATPPFPASSPLFETPAAPAAAATPAAPPAPAPARVPAAPAAAMPRPAPAAPVAPVIPTATVAPELPPAAEKVYDLAEFDAQPLPPDAVADSAPERIHDLSEFGAVRIG